MEYVRRNPRKVVGALLAGVAAVLLALEQKEASAAVGILSAMFLGGGAMEQDQGSKRK